MKSVVVVLVFCASMSAYAYNLDLKYHQITVTGEFEEVIQDPNVLIQKRIRNSDIYISSGSFQLKTMSLSKFILLNVIGAKSLGDETAQSRLLAELGIPPAEFDKLVQSTFGSDFKRKIDELRKNGQVTCVSVSKDKVLNRDATTVKYVTTVKTPDNSSRQIFQTTIYFLGKTPDAITQITLASNGNYPDISIITAIREK